MGLCGAHKPPTEISDAAGLLQLLLDLFEPGVDAFLIFAGRAG
jgi:hypothetical protein